MSRELTANWLRQNIARYQNKDTLYAHVLAALDRYPSLRPKTDVYTFDDGRTQLLLCIHGLLPISYRTASYNIPIAIWLVLSYPAVAPLVYVVPTSDMLVKPSSQVDHSGRCNLEYLAHWSRKPEAHSLILLLEAMQSYFSNDPPLYAKARSKPSAGPSPIATPAISSPTPSDRDHVTHAPDPSLPPRLPPKPFSTGPGAVVAPGSSSSHTLGAATSPSSAISTSSQTSTPSVSQTHAPNYSNYAPHATGTEVRDSVPLVPPHPSGPFTIFATASSSDAPRGRHQDAKGPPPYASANPPVPPRPPVPPSPLAHRRGASVPPVTNGPVATSTQSPSPMVPRAYTQPSAVHPDPPYAGAFPTTSYSSDVFVPASGYQQTSAPAIPPAAEPHRPPPPDLLDEDDLNSISAPNSIGTEIAPPPPRPPNPQTVALHNALHSSLRDALSRMATTHTDALARQRAAQTELLAGPVAIRDESARLVAVRDVCRAVGDRWDALIDDGERALAEMRRRGEVGVDEMVCASSIVGNQLVNLVAEDNAIEDTTYHLHRALVSGRIDLERFLRTTRVLAEEQFMKRALVEKILRGLPMGVALR